jgi:hypothetical protein
MAINSSSIQSLRRVFQQSFTARDIAEPLVSFDEDASSDVVKAFMDKRGFETVGLRHEGVVAGYALRTSLAGGACADHRLDFAGSQRIVDSTPLSEIVLRLKDQPRLFVSALGQVCGIISRSDLQKPAVRMWLFGLVTLIEMRLSALIEQFFPGEEWQTLLTEGRLQKARELLAERSRRHQELTLLDCLQISDKSRIVARHEILRGLTRFESRRQLEDATSRLENLRNNLAHAQDIITTDWETVVMLAERLDDILEGPPAAAPPEAH